MGKFGLTVLLLAIVAGSSVSFTSASGHPGATVILHIFSGRPDPTWALAAGQIHTLRSMVEGLPDGQPAEEPAQLGYRGFSVTFKGVGTQELRVFDGHVRLKTNNRTRWLDDAGRTLEYWLLASAGDTLPKDLVIALRSEFARSSDASAEGFGIYLLDDALSPSEVAQADLDTLEIQPKPIIDMGDIVLYHAESHEIELTGSALARVNALQVPVSGIPFVVCVGAERIYPGAFWTSFSSLSYDESPVIDVPARTNLSIRIQLGYPESPELYTGKDLRADPRILAALEAAGKLK